MSACAACLARPWLLARLAGHLDRVRDRTLPLLELDNAELVAALGGTATVADARTRPGRVRRRRRPAPSGPAGVELICRCDDDYPAQLAALAAPPAVLHVPGGRQRFLELVAHSPVAIVGARRASPYGLDVARVSGARTGRGRPDGGQRDGPGHRYRRPPGRAGQRRRHDRGASRRPRAPLPGVGAGAAPPHRRCRRRRVRAPARDRRAAVDVPGPQPGHRRPRRDDRRGRGPRTLRSPVDRRHRGRAGAAGGSRPRPDHLAAGRRAAWAAARPTRP